MHYVVMVVLCVCGWSCDGGENKSGEESVELVKGGDIMCTVSNLIYADNVVPFMGREADVCRLVIGQVKGYFLRTEERINKR